MAFDPISGQASISVVPYRPEFRAAFERLNRVWLEGHDLLEPVDLEYLQDPEGRILATGGQVFFAVEHGAAIGSCAAIRIAPTIFELAKLAVDPAAQRRGLGRKLSEAVIEFARDAGAIQVVLTSHTSLVDAIRLYETLGFRHADLPADVRYQTANVYMTLDLEGSV